MWMNKYEVRKLSATFADPVTELLTFLVVIVTILLLLGILCYFMNRRRMELEAREEYKIDNSMHKKCIITVKSIDQRG